MNVSKLPAHVVGAGNIGCLVAAALSPQCDVRLVLKSNARLLDYKQHGSTIRLRTTDIGKNPTIIERQLEGVHIPKKGIENLVLTSKAYQAETAIKTLMPYISSETNILLLQNGIGLHEQLHKYISLHSKDSVSPKFHFGVVSHGVHNSTTNIPWEFNHVGHGNIKLASLNDQGCELLKELQAAPLLNAHIIPIDDFWLLQMEKLVVNACINPLTAILGCKNGSILESCSPGFLQSLVNESCNILLAHHSSLTNGDYTKALMANIALNPTRMYKMVRDVATVTAENKSSMLADIEKNQTTELYYINRYLMRLGGQYKLTYTRNQVLSELVEATVRTATSNNNKYVPLESKPIEEQG